MNTANFAGTLRAFASDQHPLQTIIELVLTDFNPNNNKQRIPKTEAENIVKTALNMPVKIRLEGGKHKGHAQSYPIGTLTDVWIEEDVIKGRSILWREEYPDEDKYLRKATAEGKFIGNSWEVFYKEGIVNDGIEDLSDCIFASTVIVEKPAYGTRTPILSIAEETMEELEKMREDLIALLNLIDTMYYEIAEAEYEKSTIENASAAMERCNEMISALKQRKSMAEDLQSKITALETENSEIKTKLETIEREKAEAEDKKAKDELLEKRRKVLSDDLTDEFILSLTDEQVDVFSKKLKAKSEIISVPEPYHSSTLSTKELAKALKEAKE